MTTANQILVKNELWRRGNLVWKLHAVQKEMYNIYKTSPEHSTLVWLLSRQLGKTYLLCCIALETAIQNSNGIVKIVTDTKIHARNIIEKTILEILADCPDEQKPVYHKADFEYVFANGAKIQLAGSDGGHIEKLRGQKCLAVFIDEAGFCNDLDNAVKSVLLPTTTHTGGRIVLASTPPAEEDHDFWKFVEIADQEGHLTKKTIYENPLLDATDITRIIKEMGGVENDRFKREYLCENIRSDETVVFPEFTTGLRDKIVKQWPKPDFFDTYVAMDLGFIDLTVVLFGFYDFKAGKLIVEDEIVVKGKDLILKDFGRKVLGKEAELWTNPNTGDKTKPLIRVSDINYLVTENLARETNYQLTFIIPDKYDKESNINNVRTLLQAEKIIISPKCSTLLRHLQYCQWNKSKKGKEFARSSENGHYDAADALLYLVKSVIWSKNPYPAYYNLNMQNTIIQGQKSVYNSGVSRTNIDVFKKIYGRS